jgi:DNA polymerase III delta prime subunit
VKNINKIDGETMVINTKEINEKLKNPSEFLTFSENRVLNQIDDCAAQILPLANTKPIILISGPSGSSKTTTAFYIKHYVFCSGSKLFAHY